jgi:hypothetical protein
LPAIVPYRGDGDWERKHFLILRGNKNSLTKPC